MDRDFRRGRIEIDFPTRPFDSIYRVLADSTQLFFSTLPFLAAVTLAIMFPAKIALQVACSAMDIAPEGFLSYLVMDLSDLVLSALVIPAIVYGLVTKFRTGKTAGVAESLRWGRRQWGKTLWNKVKVEITIALWGALLVIPGVVAMLRLTFTDTIVAIEADREPAVLDRSRSLSAGQLWRILLALLPALPLSLAHMYAAFRALQYSRAAMVPLDSLFCVAEQWPTVVALLMYLGLAAPRKSGKRG